MEKFVKYGGMYLPAHAAAAESVRRIYASGYREAGASRTRRALKGFTAESHSPVEDIDSVNMTLRQRSRVLYMSSSVAAAAINTNRTKIIGTGLQLRPEPVSEILGMSAEQAELWADRTEEEFALWAEDARSCDALGIGNFAELQALAATSWLMNGDVAALITAEEPTAQRPYTLRIRMIEADRICTPFWAGKQSYIGADTEGTVPEGRPGAGHRIHDGVEVDENGHVCAYYICDCYPQEIAGTGSAEWERVEAYGAETGMPNIMVVGTQERCEQHRGVPYLAGVIEELLQLRRYTDTQLMAALIQTMYTAWVETDAGSTQYPFNEVGPGVVGMDGDARASDVSSGPNEYSMGAGIVNVLDPGEKIVFGNPNIPTAGFDIFVKSITRNIGAALGMPHEVMLKEFTNNYSASRGALVEAYEEFKRRRKIVVDKFCQPIYQRWLTEAVATGRVKAPGFFDDPLIRSAWMSARWIGPVQGVLDPVKEAQAASQMVAQGFKTHTQQTAELGGGDWWENISAIKRENEALADALSAIAAMNGSEDPNQESTRDGDGDGFTGE